MIILQVGPAMDNSSSFKYSPSSASEAVIAANGDVNRLSSSYELDLDNVNPVDGQFIPFPEQAINDSAINELSDTIEASDRFGLQAPPKPKASYLGLFTVVVVILGTFAWTSLSLFDSPKSLGFVSSSAQSRPTTNSSSNYVNQTPESITTHQDSSDRAISKQPGNAVGNDAATTPVTINGKANDIARYERVMEDLAREIAAAEQTANRSQDKNAVSEKAMNEAFKKQLSAGYRASNKNEQREAGNRQQLTSNIFTEKNISALLHQYKEAYEQGNLKTLLALFGTDHLTKQRIDNLRTKFQPVFANTAKRSISFKNITWRSNEEVAIVTSPYRAVLELKNNKGTQNISADASIRIHSVGHSLRISSVHLVNSKVNVQTPDMLSASLNKKSITDQSRNAKRPTPAQLQYITTQLITAYEAGDINKFSSLFAEDVKSNDRLDRAGLMKDYQQLFNTSSDRQMFIQNMHWQNEPIGAKGTGDLQVMVLSENGSDVYSMEGKIEIVAQRRNNKVLITHLYHIERQK
jgi:hypothetical protein